MNPPAYYLDVMRGNNVTPAQEQFINHYNQCYFGEVAVAKGLTKAPVHWRLILRKDQCLLSHVALTELGIEMDGQMKKAGAVGGCSRPIPYKEWDTGTH